MIINGTQKEFRNISLPEAVTEFVRSRQNQAEKNSSACLSKVLSQFIVYCSEHGVTNSQKITQSLVYDFIRRQASYWSTGGREEYQLIRSAIRARVRFTLLFLQYLHFRKYLAEGIVIPKTHSKRSPSGKATKRQAEELSELQVNQVLAYFSNQLESYVTARNKTLFRFLVETNARVSECNSIQWKDFNNDEKQVTFYGVYIDDKREVRISLALASELALLKKMDSDKFGYDVIDSSFIFHLENGAPMSSYTIERIISKAGDALGFIVNPKLCRRFCISSSQKAKKGNKEYI